VISDIQYEAPYWLPTPVGSLWLAASRISAQSVHSDSSPILPRLHREWAAFETESPIVRELADRDACLNWRSPPLTSSIAAVSQRCGGAVVVVQSIAKTPTDPVLAAGTGRERSHARISRCRTHRTPGGKIRCPCFEMAADPSRSRVVESMILHDTVLLTLEITGFLCARHRWRFNRANGRTAPGVISLNTNEGRPVLTVSRQSDLPDHRGCRQFAAASVTNDSRPIAALA